MHNLIGYNLHAFPITISKPQTATSILSIFFLRFYCSLLGITLAARCVIFLLCHSWPFITSPEEICCNVLFDAISVDILLLY